MKILITGDLYLGSARMQDAAEKDSVTEIFDFYMDHIAESDLAITNLESPVLNFGESIVKTGPSLKASVKSLNIVKSAGFDLMTLANNHIMDYGDQGLVSTLEACKKIGLNSVGAGEDLNQAKEPFYYEKDEVKIAVFNISENEFSTTNGEYPGANPLNLIDNFYSIQEIKKKVDKLILVLHGGHEFYSYPSVRMKNTYRFFVDAGADAVICHHTHWYSGYEIYKNAPIFYSLGNFLFENTLYKTSSNWNTGYGVLLDISLEGIKPVLLPYKQNDKKLGLQKLTEEERVVFEKSIEDINKVISDDDLLEAKFNELCVKRKNLYANYLEPHSSAILRKLQRMGLVSSLLSRKKKTLLLNLVKCESHRDVLIKHLSN